MEERAQGALEYLLIIGAAIIVVAVAVYALMTMATTANLDSGQAQGSIGDSFDDLGGLPGASCTTDFNGVGCCPDTLPTFDGTDCIA
jgi:hypothetical protein